MADIVSTQAEYTFIAQQDRSLIAVFAPESRLPAGYTEVEYIHWDGYNTTFALLENVVANTDKVLLEVKPDQVTSSSGSPSWILYIGTLVSTSGQYLSLKAYGSILSYLLNSSTAKTYGFSSPIVNTMLKFSLDFLHKNFTVNGISLTGYQSSHSLGTMINILGRSATSTQSATKYAMQGYFYSMRHYRNNNLIREYAPCVAPDGTAGIFEIFSKTFIKNTCNSATGITPGPVV